MSPAPPAARRPVLLAAAALLLALLAAYHDSFSGAFVFDDLRSVTTNPSIRRLSDLGTVLRAHGSPVVAGRPLLNLTFALNYAAGRLDPASYHAVNFAVHALAALALLGLVRRTLLLPASPPALLALALPLAASAAALWSLHPLLTEAVTYVSQRAESLMGLAVLLTLYALVRATASPAPRRWLTFSIAACAAGMATKETMVAAPAVVLLFDRAFLAGSLRAALRLRRGYYAALAGTWLLLAALMLGTVGHQRGVGFGYGTTSWEYLRVSSRVILHYLQLIAWPHPLVFDYGALGADFPLPSSAASLVLCGALAAAAALAAWRRPRAGFLAAAFFILLAPTTSVVPLPPNPAAESRLYLPCAALAVLATCVLAHSFGRRGLAAALALALVGGVLTARRNPVYRDGIALFSDTVARVPANARAHETLATLLRDERRDYAGALRHFHLAIRPGGAKAQAGIGGTLGRQGEFAAAEDWLRRAVAIAPAEAAIRSDLGHVLNLTGRPEEARAEFSLALRDDPTALVARANLAQSLLGLRRFAEVEPLLLDGLRLDPDAAALRLQLGNLRGFQGRFAEARTELLEAVRLDPASSEAHRLLGDATAALGRPREAAAALELALRLDPRNAAARQSLDRLHGGAP